jgi:mono/diheme cytochrome c family protein
MRLSHFLAGVAFAAAIGLGVAETRSQDVAVPEFSTNARQGGMLFSIKCASCHGLYGDGTDKGPPLLHKFYHPGHHSDRSFWAAIRNGSKQHHWTFGPMKPVEGVTDEQIPLLIDYVRELQKANGIF